MGANAVKTARTAGADRGVRRAGVALLALAMAATAAGCSSSSGSKPAASASSTPPGAASGPGTAAGTGQAADLQSAYEKVVSDVLPSVVEITTDSGLGSGVVYDTSGDIVTNDHVVGSSKTFQVTLATGSKTLSASLVGTYPTDDLAVIKLDSPPSGLKPATFADSSKLVVGQIVLAMGNPLGLSASVTEGIVSAVDRTVSEPSGSGSPGATIPGAIQTSAAINPGNSGGALVDLGSQVVGIPTLAATDPETGGSAAPGIGFAIPSNTVKNIADQLIKSGSVSNSGRAALGVTVRTVLGSSGTGAGAGVVSTTPGGPAATAGIQAGDTIVSVNGTPITSSSDLSAALAQLKPGDKAQIGLVRADGSNATVTVTLGQL